MLIDREMYKVRKQQRSLILLVCVLLGVNMLLFGAGLWLLLYNRQQPVMVQPVAVPAATNVLTAPETAEAVPEPELELEPEEEPEPEEVPEIIKRVPPAPKPRAKKEPVRKDPDVLPLGIRLRLPRKEEYGIDASDPSSLRRARALAKSLTGR